MPDYTIPRPNEPLLDQDGTPSLRWYNFWRTRLAGSSEEELQAEIETIARKLGSPDGSVEGIPDFDLDGFLSSATKIIGIQSVTVVGSLANGTVFLQLDGDLQSPPSGYYYGTNGDGVRGWYMSMGNGIGTFATYQWAPGVLLPTWGQFSAGAETSPALATEFIFNRRDRTGQDHGGILKLLTENSILYGQSQVDDDAWGRFLVTGTSTPVSADAASIPVTLLDAGSNPLTGWEDVNILLLTAVDPSLIDHNELDNLQGGSPTERYHLTAAEAASVPTAIQEVVAGTGITVDVTDPIRPVVNATGGGTVTSVTAQYSVEDVGTATDPILQLDNDVASPSALTAYSADSGGTRGWHRPALFESTGVIDGCALSIGAPNTTFTIAAGTLGFTDWSITPVQPTRVVLPFAGATNVPVTGIGSSVVTYVGVNSSGAVIQQSSPFTNTQSRSIAVVGVVVHSNLSTVNAVNNQPVVIRAGVNQIADFMQAIGALNLTGNVYSANGANLNINKSAGTLFKMGSNFQSNDDDPHVTAIGAQTALTFRYRTSTGVETADTTNILPNVWESAPGVVSAIPILGNQWHIQRISLFQSGATRIQYGQNLYPSLAAAAAGIGVDAFTTEPNIAENAVLRCYLIINRGLLGLLGSAQFSNVTKFGAIASGGSAVTAAAITSALGYTPLADAPSDGTTYGRKDGAWQSVTAGTGTVTNVALSVPTGLSVSGSPITTSGTFTVTYDTGYQGYTSTEASKLSDIAADATVGADWNTNLSNIPANITAWTSIAPSTKADDSNVVHKTGTETIGGNKTFGPMTVITFDQPGSSSAGSSLQFTSPATVPGFVAMTGASSRADFRFAANEIRLGVSASSSAPSNFFVITPAYVAPFGDGTLNCGDASRRFSTYYGVNGAINTSDAREKQDIRDLTEQEIACAIDLGRLPCIYRWIQAVQEKGEAARLHCSPTVQAVMACMESHGIDPFRWGFVCYDEWPETPEERDEDGNVTQEYRPAGDRYSLRPSELAWFVIRGQAARQDALEARIAALESLV